MAFLVAFFSLLMVAIGLYGIANPVGLVSFTRLWQGQSGVWTGAAIRIVFGIALWRSAPSSHTPVVFEFLGLISLVSGAALPFIGVERLTKIISWWSGRSSAFIRGWSAVAIALGALLFWSAAA
ncbi:MAG TPA: hypothetical protein DEP35_06375 [Deltaproteobacteria bacterium]|jgi:hypothetical protein|nr:hypothetical protein [Deltaproteobacteria bacterium]